MIPNTLAIMTTYKCNYRCHHCSVSSGPESNTTLSWEYMKMALDQADLIASIRLVVFTGGESSLYPDLIKKGISYATEKGMFTRLVTNAWWADTMENTRETLKEWVNLGLKEVNISYDDFHIPYLEKYGGEQNVINVVQAAKEFGISVLIGSVIHPKAKIRTSYLRQMIRNAGISGELQCMEDFLFSLGRAKGLSEDYFHLIPEEINKSGCSDVGRTMVLLPTGEVTFCCGHILNSEAQKLIILGKLEEETLSKIITRMQHNVLCWWLYFKGPQDIAKKLGIDDLQHRSCELCYKIATQYMDSLLSLEEKKEEIFESLTLK